MKRTAARLPHRQMVNRWKSESRHSPTVATLKEYAMAVGCKLKIRLVRSKRVAA